MKNALILLSLVFTQVSLAAINNSNYVARHQAIIEKEIQKRCGYMRNLTVISSTEEVIHIDQGITDVKFLTILKGEQKMDQNIFDTFTITVASEYADGYDHTAQDWGFYNVNSVKCEME